MNPKATILFLLCSAAVLAGCTEDAAPSTGLDGVQFNASTGSVRGIILDETQLPIPGARIEVAGTDLVASTGEAGDFVVNFVPPGDQVLIASADGFVPREVTVTVQAATVTEDVQVTLESLGSNAPYALTETHRRTISGLTFKLTPDCIYVGEFGNSLVPNPAWSNFATTKTCTGFTLDCSGGDPCSTWFFTSILENNTDWRTILLEGSWIPSSAATGRSFYLDMVAPGYRDGAVVFTDKEVWYDMSNQPPIVIRADRPDELVERGIPEEQWCCEWRARLFPAQCDLGNCFERFGPDIGLMVDQTLDLYFSFAIHAPFPPDYSARPLE